MRTILAMVGKDLRRKRRSPLGVVGALLFPILFAAMIGVTFGRGDDPPRMSLIVRNDDAGPLGNLLVGALNSDRSAEFLDVDVVESGGAELLARRSAAGLLTIPGTFSDDVLHGRPTSLALVRNPAQGIFPEILEQLAGVLVEALDAGSKVLRGPLETIAAMDDLEGAPPDGVLVPLTLEIRDTLEGASALVFPPAITLVSEQRESEDGASGRDAGALFLAFLPGVSVYALFLLGDLGMRDLLEEGEQGTLRRQIAGPVGGRTVVLGKASFAAVLALAGLVVQSAVGVAFVRVAVDVPAFLILSAALVLAVVGAAATIYGAAGSERRGTTVASVVYLAMAFLGGAFTAQQLPAALDRVAPLSPLYWGTDGFRLLLRDGAGLTAIGTHVAVLAIEGAVLLALGGWLLERRIRRGAVS